MEAAKGHTEYLEDILPSCMVALDQEYVYDQANTMITSEKAEIAIIPPISGGWADPELISK